MEQRDTARAAILCQMLFCRQKMKRKSKNKRAFDMQHYKETLKHLKEQLKNVPSPTTEL